MTRHTLLPAIDFFLLLAVCFLLMLAEIMHNSGDQGINMPVDEYVFTIDDPPSVLSDDNIAIVIQTESGDIAAIKPGRNARKHHININANAISDGVFSLRVQAEGEYKVVVTVSSFDSPALMSELAASGLRLQVKWDGKSRNEDLVLEINNTFTAEIES